MWTLADDNRAWMEGWWIGPNGIVGDFDLVKTRAAEGSELHSRAIQHVTLCRLTNTSPGLQSMQWASNDNLEALQEGWWLVQKGIEFDPNFFPSREVFMLYMQQNAVLFRSLLHMKALRNTQ